MRRRAAVERAREHDRVTRGTKPLAQFRDQGKMRGPVAALPIQPDPCAVERDAAIGIGQILAHGVEIDCVSTEPVQCEFGYQAQIGFEDLAGYSTEQLDVAERRTACAVVEIEVIDAERLLINGVIDRSRIDRQYGRRIMVHEMPADLVALVGNAALGGPQQQRSRIDRAGGQHDQPGLQRVPLAANVAFDAFNPFAVGRHDQALDFRSCLQRDVGMGERGGKTASLGIHFPGPRIGKRVPRRGRAFHPGIDVDTERQRRRVQPRSPQSLPGCRDGRFVRDSRQRIGCGMAWFGGVIAEFAADAIQALGLCVPGLQLVVIERPAWGRPFCVRDRPEVARAVSDQNRTVKLAVSTDIIIVARVERLTRSVCPRLGWAIKAALKDGPCVARFGRICQLFAAFENDDAGARRRKPGGERRATHA